MFHISLDCLYSFLKVLSTKFPLKKKTLISCLQCKNHWFHGSYISSKIIPRRIDPWGCFVGQLVPLHEIIPPVGAMGEKPTIWEPSIYEGHEGLHGLSEVLFCACFFLVKTFKNLHGLLWYCSSLWRRSMLLFEHRVSVSSQLSYQGGDRLSNCCYRVRLHLTCNVQACTSLLLQVVAQSPQTKHLKQPHDFQPGNPYLN